MRKGILILVLAALAVQVQAQNINAQRVTVRDSIWLRGHWIHGFSDDSTMGEGDPGLVPTQEAIKGALSTVKVLDTVHSIESLKNYNGPSSVLIVSDSMRGGTFYKSGEDLQADGGTIFKAFGSGFWVRRYDHSNGVQIDWWGSRDSYSILKAVAAAGENGTINFTPGKTYRQYDAIIPLNGQTFHGNRATLFRAPMTITTLKADANPDDSFFVVNNMPADWKVGDYIFPFDDSLETPHLIYYARKIVDINQDTAFVDHPINFDRPTQTTIPAGVFIWKVFHQFTSVVPDSLGSNWAVPLHYQIDNLIFDGNKDSTSAIPSWYINNAIFNMGFQVKLFQDEFYNLPSDCINGHGYEIIDCIAKNINASFVHVSKNATLMNRDQGIIATGNYTDSTNLKWAENGHGTAVIELSNSAGYFIFSNNRFYNGSNNAIGLFTGSQGAKGYRSYGSHEVIISNNYFKNFPYIYNGAWFAPDDDTTGNITGIYIYGNVFDSCGQNDYTSRQTALNDWTQGVRVGDNLLLHGTTFKFPVINQDSTMRYILNNATGTPQVGNININGNVAITDTMTTNKAIISNLSLTGSGASAITGFSQTIPSTPRSYFLPSEIAVKNSIVDTLANIEQLESFTGSNSLVYITDSFRGGLFYKSSEPLTADSGIVFNASGGGYWVRQYDKALGVNVDWWGESNSNSILKAVAFAGENGTINFTPNKTYLQYDGIIPLRGQTFSGNGSILKRMPVGIDSLAVNGQFTDTFVVVHAVPLDWKVGDWIQLYQDTMQRSNFQFQRQITRINGDSIFLSYKLDKQAQGGDNSLWPTINYWAADSTKIRKVFAQFACAADTNSSALNYNGSIPNHFNIYDITFDGNKDNTGQNVSWYVNQAIYARGDSIGVKIKGCTFENMPNDCINGHAFMVENNVAYNLNSSFIHLSYFYNSWLPTPIYAQIKSNYVDSIDIMRDEYTGHSEGAITLSYSSGFSIITNNVFKNCFGPVLGTISGSNINVNNHATRNMIISNNYFKDFKGIAFNVAVTKADSNKAGNIYINGNIFEDCDTTDWTSYRQDIDTLALPFHIGDNLLTGNTIWKVPVFNSDSSMRYILNNSTTTPQIANINVAGGVTATKYQLSDLNTAPSSATDTGTKGEIRVTTDYIYVCVATNTWVRAALTTW